MPTIAPWGALLAAVLGGLAPAAKAGADADGWADIIRVEQARGNPLPRLSDLVPAFTLDEAYAVQHALVDVERLARPIGGYKAGFTNPAGRARFALNGPVSGVLFADGAHDDGAAIALDEHPGLVIEVEVGYLLRSAIRRPMKSLDDLATYIRDVVPVVELPTVHYDQPERLTGVDIVATNMASSAYVVGRPFALPRLGAANDLPFVLTRDGEAVDEGHASNAMGDQLAALLWLVNHLYAAGWPLEAGHLLITGTLGRMNPGRPGHYVVDYGGRARLAFELVAPAAVASPHAQAK
ncbi:MAG: 2-keto-4-pentenoate hydratase [Gammaproteobacteria bacterium]